MDVKNKIESILFISGEPITMPALAKAVGVSKKEIEEGIEALKAELQGRGVRLLRHENSVALVTAPENADLVGIFLKEELKSNLSKAAIETLTVILYKTPVSRAAIDYIRGVNSSFTLHTLLMRGLIERAPDPNDARIFLYKPSAEFLKYCGLASIDELPEYTLLAELKNKELAAMEKEGQEQENAKT